ncbi:helix-turn-helix domain-containing protein [uncultured Tateyamaria sp.]|uniref:helix-turn-helix domain-containing protein n=1 Tax=uncultured Tateyamaria sp. TaxID=455651 RepID=UPI00261209B4|nr:helix-turn-helix domain-containing protein [uncultured Tateyamaria sp.]
MYITLSAENRPDTSLLAQDKGHRTSPRTLLKKGKHLYREGDEVERIYQVETGVVRLTRMLEDGRRQVIAFGYPGDIIGFPADGCHHTDCEALVDTTLQAYNRAALDHGNGDPDLHMALLHAALREISAMQDHVMMLGRKSAAEKVASFLNVITQRYGEDLGVYRQIDLPMSRSDIADFLGLTTETVSRAFTALRLSGVIALDGAQTIIVMQPAMLQDLSRGSN